MRADTYFAPWAPGDAERLAVLFRGWDVPDTRPCQRRVVILDVTDDSSTRVRCDATYPAWSPDASHMIVSKHIWDTADFDLVNVDLATSDGTISVPATLRYYRAESADWRPTAAPAPAAAATAGR